jgi:amino acid transporter/nucleotide-binding universal stress UspA family protein
VHGGGGERPRELRWYHAAGMLFGDWGTSRLYVLGLAYVMLRREATPHASFWYVAAMCVLVTLVGFSYTIICKHFPDGGGVYSASKQRSRSLAVIGALLLIADYIVTVALSSYDGFRYMLPLPASMAEDTKKTIALFCAASSLAAIGCINIFGPRRAGTLALIVAVISGVFYFIVGAACVPHLSAATIHVPTEPLSMQWQHFVGVILALSGVEAIANMTGVMAEPVAKNASKAIFVVLLEVVVLNLVMAYAMNALPVLSLGENGHTVAGFGQSDVQDHMIKVLATEYVGPAFAVVSSFFFGLLLLSAANTAILGMVSIQYLMSRDHELPRVFTRLNKFGMPWVGLVTATLFPALVLLFVGSDMEMLADLYAIGVVGAITINMLACATNKQLDLAPWERMVLMSVGLVVAFIEFSIAYDKPKALIFAMTIVGVGLIGRFIAKREWTQVGIAGAGIAAAALAFLVLPYAAQTGIISTKPQVSHLQSFVYMGCVLSGIFAASLLARAPVVIESPASTVSKTAIRREESARSAIPVNAPRLLVPTRGSPKLMRFAASYAKDKKAALFALFVREVAIAFRERTGSVATETMTLANDEEAKKIFAEARKVCDEMGVPMAKIYVVHDSPAEMILDHAATLGVDAVLMGVSQRGALWKIMRGEVLQEVIEYLPESIPLLIHA